MSIIKLDGMRFEINPPNNNEETDENSVNRQVQRIDQSGTTDIVQPTELGEAMKELNDDSLDPLTRMSKIDMRTRLHPFEINSILAMDSLVALKVLPTTCLAFTRQKKRLNVSLMGKGRQESVDMAVGKREADKQSMMGGLGDKIKGFFPGGGEK